MRHHRGGMAQASQGLRHGRAITGTKVLHRGHGTGITGTQGIAGGHSSGIIEPKSLQSLSLRLSMIPIPLGVVTKHLGAKEFEEKWASERTILRAELIMDQIELILLRDHLPKAICSSACWDLSPQANKEFLVTILRVVWRAQDLPDIYSRDQQVAGSDNVVCLNFVLPLVQCPSTGHQDVAKKLDDHFKLVGLDPKQMTEDGPMLITSDGGSPNEAAMRLLFKKPTAKQDHELFIRIYCACHGWNLAFTHGCDHIPGRSKKAEYKNTKMSG